MHYAFTVEVWSLGSDMELWTGAHQHSEHSKNEECNFVYGILDINPGIRRYAKSSRPPFYLCTTAL